MILATDKNRARDSVAMDESDQGGAGELSRGRDSNQIVSHGLILSPPLLFLNRCEWLCCFATQSCCGCCGKVQS